MAIKALNFKMDEADIIDMKKVAGVFNISITDLVKQAIREYVDELKRDPFYRLTVNVQDADEEETEEIIAAIEEMSDDDLSVACTRHFSL